MAREHAVHLLAGQWDMDTQAARLLVSKAHAHGSARDTTHNAVVTWSEGKGFTVADMWTVACAMAS